MNAKTAIQELQAYIRKLKKQPASVQIRKAVVKSEGLDRILQRNCHENHCASFQPQRANDQGVD